MAIIDGYCRLTLSGQYESTEIITNLLLRFFNEKPDSIINQHLGIFFEALIARRRQDCVLPAMIPALLAAIETKLDPELILKFVIKLTEPNCPALIASRMGNAHNTIALTVVSTLQTLQDNKNNSELVRLLTKSLCTLLISDDAMLRTELIDKLDQFVNDHPIETKAQRHIEKFKSLMTGEIIVTAENDQLTETTREHNDDNNGAEDHVDGDEHNATTLPESSIEKDFVVSVEVHANQVLDSPRPPLDNSVGGNDETVSVLTSSPPTSKRTPPKQISSPPPPSLLSTTNRTSNKRKVTESTSPSITTYGIENTPQPRQLRRSLRGEPAKKTTKTKTPGRATKSRAKSKTATPKRTPASKRVTVQDAENDNDDDGDTESDEVIPETPPKKVSFIL